MEQWAVVYVAPNSERQFLKQLEALNYVDCGYFPVSKYYSRPRHKHKLKELFKPVFPGYVFLRMQQDIYWHASELSMFLYALCFEEKLFTVTDDVIFDLRQRESAGNFDQLPLVSQLRGIMQRGVKVRIDSGSFAGQIATVEKVIRGNRVRVSINGHIVTMPLVPDNNLVYSVVSSLVR